MFVMDLSLFPQVLFDWTSHALTLFYSKKMDLAQEVVEGLWVYFDDIIHSKKLQNVLSQGKTISLRITVAQVRASVYCLRKAFCVILQLY